MSAPSLIAASGDSLREAFGKALLACSETRPNVVALDADIAGDLRQRIVRTAQGIGDDKLIDRAHLG